jgi:hypothetical protein
MIGGITSLVRLTAPRERLDAQEVQGTGREEQGRRWRSSTQLCVLDYKSRVMILMIPRGWSVAALAIGLGAVFPALSASPQEVASAANIPAAWTPRQVHVVYSDFCDPTYEQVKRVLLQLGARPSDLNVSELHCPAPNGAASIDATFSVLVPIDPQAKNAAGAPVDAHWQTVELKGSCIFLFYMTRKVLPLFSARNVKRIPWDFCGKYHFGLRADILMPSRAPPGASQ